MLEATKDPSTGLLCVFTGEDGFSIKGAMQAGIMKCAVLLHFWPKGGIVSEEEKDGEVLA